MLKVNASMYSIIVNDAIYGARAFASGCLLYDESFDVVLFT